MKSSEVEDRLDSIIEFVDIGDAIHRALRTYSSGMRAQLQFAIATSVAPHLLLIDEALSAALHPCAVDRAGQAARRRPRRRGARTLRVLLSDGRRNSAVAERELPRHVLTEVAAI